MSAGQCLCSQGPATWTSGLGVGVCPGLPTFRPWRPTVSVTLPSWWKFWWTCLRNGLHLENYLLSLLPISSSFIHWLSSYSTTVVTHPVTFFIFYFGFTFPVISFFLIEEPSDTCSPHIVHHQWLTSSSRWWAPQSFLEHLPHSSQRKKKKKEKAHTFHTLIPRSHWPQVGQSTQLFTFYSPIPHY